MHLPSCQSKPAPCSMGDKKSFQHKNCSPRGTQRTGTDLKLMFFTSNVTVALNCTCAYASVVYLKIKYEQKHKKNQIKIWVLQPEGKTDWTWNKVHKTLGRSSSQSSKSSLDQKECMSHLCSSICNLLLAEKKTKLDPLTFSSTMPLKLYL